MDRVRVVSIALLIFILGAALPGATQTKSQSRKSITVVYKDGHQKTFSMPEGSRIDFKSDALVLTHGGQQENIPIADVLRLDFEASSKLPPFGRNHFIGKWEFGEGPGMGSFYVTLDADGQAHKSIGAPHGTWVLVDGEARISWDDGWHDVIRKVGNKHEKFAYEPGKSLRGEPSNVAQARSLNGETM